MATMQPNVEPATFVPAIVGPAAETKSAPADEHRFLIRNIDWQTYKTIADALPDRHYHMSYDGDLELMSTSFDHDRCSRLLCQFVVVLTELMDMTRSSCGAMTLDREDLEKGIEPDEGFYLINEPRVRGKRKIDLEVDPPPDLGIEVDLTTDSRRRMSIYAKIKIPEIWRFDGNVVTIQSLNDTGQYSESERSGLFPFLAAADLSRFLQQRDEKDETSLLKSFREWVREQVAK